jgi:hypothetical protein
LENRKAVLRLSAWFPHFVSAGEDCLTPDFSVLQDS